MACGQYHNGEKQSGDEIFHNPVNLEDSCRFATDSR
jgi:hypothetical protein